MNAGFTAIYSCSTCDFVEVHNAQGLYRIRKHVKEAHQ